MSFLDAAQTQFIHGLLTEQYALPHATPLTRAKISVALDLLYGTGYVPAAEAAPFLPKKWLLVSRITERMKERHGHDVVRITCDGLTRANMQALDARVAARVQSPRPLPVIPPVRAPRSRAAHAPAPAT